MTCYTFFQKCLDILDVGARESLSDVVNKVLRKILHQPEGKDEEIDDTLLTWSLDVRRTGIVSRCQLLRILLYFKNNICNKNGIEVLGRLITSNQCVKYNTLKINVVLFYPNFRDSFKKPSSFFSLSLAHWFKKYYFLI